MVTKVTPMCMDQLKDLLLEKLPAEKVIGTDVPGLSLFRIDRSFERRPQLYGPQIILLAQGRKQVYLGERRFEYDPAHYYVQTVSLPVECEAIIEEGNPMLGMAITIDPVVIGEILVGMDAVPPPTGRVDASLYDANVTDEITEAAVRLVKALRSRSEAQFLGPLYQKEILFKALSGEHGEILRELAVNNRAFYQISRVISRIHHGYAEPFHVLELAREAGMSSTAFHSAFRTLTSLSPLQYIKSVRLHRAKELIQSRNARANTAASMVGYESATQFNREYKRLFGVSPGADRMAG